MDMIGYLSGEVISKEEEGITLLIQGVGYRILLNNRTLDSIKIDKKLAFWISYIGKKKEVCFYMVFELKEERGFLKRS